MSGTYTVDNDPTASPDYTDIGDAISALHSNGVSGPVVFEIFDDGSGYASSADYVFTSIPGISSDNTVTLRAAPGHTPRIIGAGAATNYTFYIDPEAGMVFRNNARHIRIEGLEFDIDGATQGVAFYSNSSLQPVEHIVIDGCRFHGSAGPAITGYGPGDDRIYNIVIQNCWFWNNDGERVGTSTSTLSARGTIGFSRWTRGTIQHNTIYVDSSNPAIYYSQFGDRRIELIEHNIIVQMGQGTIYGRGGSVEIREADHNLYWAPNASSFHSNYSFEDWNAEGFDNNSFFADPLMIDPANGDLRLLIDSPAKDAASWVTITHDIFGTARPVGLMADLGAEEIAPTDPRIAMRTLDQQRVADGATHQIGALGENVPRPLELYVINERGGTLELTGSPAVDVVSTTGADATVTEQPATELGSGEVANFVVEIEATGAPGQTASVELAIESNDPDHPTFTVVLEGEIVTPTPQIQLERVENEPIEVDSGEAWPYTLGIEMPNELTYTVRNIGSAPLELTGNPELIEFPMYWELEAEPTVVEVVDSVIQPYESTTFTIAVHPIGPEFYFMVAIPNNDPDPLRGDFIFHVTGHAGPLPLASISDQQIDFGATPAKGEGEQRSLTIANDGFGPLAIERYTLTDPAHAWRLADSDPLLPFFGSTIWLEPFEQLEVVFEFAPQEASEESLSATWEVETNDPANPKLSTEFSGIAEPPVTPVSTGDDDGGCTFGTSRTSSAAWLLVVLLLTGLAGLRQRRVRSGHLC